jgi:hypothetical protein
MNTYPVDQELTEDQVGRAVRHPLDDHPLDDHVVEPILDADTTRATLRSMAALTRVILGVALQAPAESADPSPELAEPLTLAPAEPAPHSVAPPHSVPPPRTIAMPVEMPELAVEPRRPLDAVPRQSEAATARDDDWIPSVAGPPRLAVVDHRAVPDRQNIGLLQEIAFLDD